MSTINMHTVGDGIDPGNQAIFDALKNPELGDQFGLVETTMNGEPVTVIGHISYAEDGSDNHSFTPLFVSITPSMKFGDETSE